LAQSHQHLTTSHSETFSRKVQFLKGDHPSTPMPWH
jgi:hypothetical protein